MRPTVTSKVDDTQGVLAAIKTDLGISQIFGVYPIEQTTEGETSLSRDQQMLVAELQGVLSRLEVKDSLEILFVPRHS